MGMKEGAAKPDIYGLPVYRTSKLFQERVGDEIHIIHGYEMFGQTVWTHVEVWLTADVIVEASACKEMAMTPAGRLERMAS